MLARLVAGLLVAAGIALATRGAGSLSTSGAVAATLVGGASMAAGWRFGLLLIAYFGVATALSRLGVREKERRTGGMVEKGGARDAAQVLANGGVFAALALAALIHPPGATFSAAALGALAASAADTWGTEIGTLWGGDPRSILSWRLVPAGTSGAVSGAGSVATVAGAAFIALAARMLGFDVAAIAIAGGGTFGALADSVLGATVQERRWCAFCEERTERRVHDCGRAAIHAGGMRRIDNDAVNLLATVAGAAAAALVTL